MTGYIRNDTSDNIANGKTANADDLDGEFNALQAAFNAVTGHTHDGTTGNGAPITNVGPTKDVVVSTTAVTPKTDNTVDLGSTLLEFKDLWIDGTANIDALVADTVDINAGTIDATIIGATTPAAGSFTTINASGAITGAALIPTGTTVPASGLYRPTTNTIGISTNTVERMRIDASGNVGVGITPTTRNNTTLQIKDGIGFPATQVSSSDPNTLDDYEVGAFTPTIVGSTTAGTGTYIINSGRYTKIGNRVFYELTVDWTAHTGTGYMTIAGLPFTTTGTIPGIVIPKNLTFSNTLAIYTIVSTTSLLLLSVSSDASTSVVNIDTSGTLYISGIYKT